ncbi:hypothetical protein A2V49_02320 [candidate division WWE3 bacterium RBG_19FT_COMBO_34_6]|uniref:Acetyltransferase n=1 Tax=candidate division WWE3 bacterium RBG_19FT_COMBO_34_6 TaxID=1802612 RepID=A0A1F4UJL8_UNCKA|nr:MAG: hypothetical protein A2V49_02320 [candidate division WWE3 bacterium RBG_19FT_COMBO_34_6]
MSYINFFLYQKVLGINRRVPWPVHFTSYVTGYKNIKMGKLCSPGSNFHQYIQAVNKIVLGDNVLMGPGVTIISSDHDFEDFNKHKDSYPIIIGNDVWLGANVVILPGVKIGNNCIVGAGSVVTKNIPDNSVAAGVPCKVIKKK